MYYFWSQVKIVGPDKQSTNIKLIMFSYNPLMSFFDTKVLNQRIIIIWTNKFQVSFFRNV